MLDNIDLAFFKLEIEVKALEFHSKQKKHYFKQSAYKDIRYELADIKKKLVEVGKNEK
jgi:hypothetical protein